MSSDEKVSRRAARGGILKAAREKLGLSREEAAAELRLGAFQIQALEEGHYDELPGATYVRGYLRAYARLVKVDEAEVLPSPVGDSDNVITGQYQPAVRQVKSSDRHVKLISFAVASAVVAFFVAWWQSRDEPFMGMPDWKETATTEAPAAADRQDAAPSLNAKTTISRPAGRESRAVQSPQSTAAASGGPRQVGFRMRDSSWLDVRDAHNRRLLNRLVPAGESIAVEGEPPFRIFIGNAGAVRVDYSGRSFDASTYQTGIFARFVLGDLAAQP